MKQDRRIPVAILTGFLGSGKTTLLSHVLKSPGMQNVAVIINEFGAVSIDHRLVASSSDNIIELRNGCVCCTINGDLVMTLRDLYQRRVLGEIVPFDYVVVETTGVADPVPLLHTLITNAPVRQRYRPDVVIACADAETLDVTLSDHESAMSQLALADVVLMTKKDRVSDAQFRAAQSRVAAVNSSAEIYTAEYGRIEADRLFRRNLFEPGDDEAGVFKWLLPTRQDSGGGVRGDHGRYRSHVLSARDPISLAGASVFLNRLVNREREQLLRIKGILCTRERPQDPAVVHAVRDKFYPVQWLAAWPDSERTSHLVVIGQSLDTRWLDEAFSRVCLN